MTLPFDAVNERTVLSACCFSYDSLEHCISNLTSSDFWDMDHRNIFLIIQDLAHKNLPISHDTVLKEVASSGTSLQLSKALEFYDENLDIEFLESKIQDLKDVSFRRNIILKCEVSSHEFKKNKDLSREDAMKWVDEVTNLIYSSEKQKTYRSVRDLLKEYQKEPSMSFLDCLKKRQEQALNGLSVPIGIPTGFREIDVIFDGFKEGHLIIIGARPGVGKTTFMCNLAINLLDMGNPAIGIMSLEMENKEVVERLALIRSEVNAKDFKCGRIQGISFQRIYKSVQELLKSEVYIDDTAGININLLYSRAKHWKKVHDIKILFVDYLQLIRGGKSNSKYEEITAISQTLKRIAKDLKICVVSLAQLNRGAEKTGKPMISDLRDSGSIEQDSDAIFLLNDPSIADPYSKGKIEVILGKNRFGPTGKFILQFEKETSKMSDFDLMKEKGKNEEEWKEVNKKD